MLPKMHKITQNSLLKKHGIFCLTFSTMLPIKNILDSLRDDVLSGKITLHEAAEELHESGWTNFIDEDAACRLLKL